MSDFFLSIVNMSISASWIVLVVLLLRLLLKKAPKWIRVLLWGVVAFRLICPFSVESVLSLIPSSETISPEIMVEKEPAIDTGVPVINDVVNPVIEESFSPDPGVSANPLQILIPVLANIWMAGMAIMLLYSVISYLRVKSKIGTAVLLRDNIFQSESVVSPFVLGVIKPRIYLPFRINEQDMNHVIAHENAHIRRKDHLWKPIGFMILSLHWFNPFIWLGYVLLCRDIELACDEKVVKELNHQQKADYAQALLTCSVNRCMIAACPLAFGELSVKDRVKSVLNYKKPAFWIIIVAIIASIVVAVCFLTDPISKEDEQLFPEKSDMDQLYVQFLSGETAANENEQKKVINDYLTSYYPEDDGKYYYTLIDMTGDGVEELCIKNYPELYFFTIKNDALYHWCTEGSAYTDLLNNGALFYERHGGAPTHIDYMYYELDEKGSVSFEISFAWYDGTTVEEGKEYPDSYYIDNKEVTKEEYEEKTEEYMSIGTDKIMWYDENGNYIKGNTDFSTEEKTNDLEESYWLRYNHRWRPTQDYGTFQVDNETPYEELITKTVDIHEFAQWFKFGRGGRGIDDVMHFIRTD